MSNEHKFRMDHNLFLSFFSGRTDIVPKFYDFKGKDGKRIAGYTPICSKAGKDSCPKKAGGISSCSDCPSPEYVSISESLLNQHFDGKIILGIYPMLSDGQTCRFIAGDFDNHGGGLDPKSAVRRLWDVCDVQGIPLAVLKSKSGNGYHAYVFFSESIPARKARIFFHALLEEAQIADDKSFDRMFPNQDETARGKGVGNLIALPFQGISNGTFRFTGFLKSDLETLEEDQWNYLSRLERIPEGRIDALLDDWNISLESIPKKTATKTKTKKQIEAATPTIEALESAIADGIPEGGRDEALYQYACRLRQSGKGRPEIESLVCGAAEKCRPPFPIDEALRKVASAFEAEHFAPGNAKSGLPEIHLQAGGLYEAVKECEKILLQSQIYQRGTSLFRPIRVSTEHKGIKRSNSLILREIDKIWLQLHLTERVNFIRYKWNKKTGPEPVPSDCPKDLAESILADSGGWPFPYIQGVIETPTVRMDGTILDEPGYDAQTGLLFDSETSWDIPENPTKEQAIEALSELRVVLKDFVFEKDNGENEAAALAAILTGVIRRALPSAPLFAFDAPKRGSGKSLLSECISIMATGQKPTMINQGRNEGELDKRIESCLFAGDAVVCIDNIEHKLSSEVLNTTLTQEYINPRILSRSKVPKTPTNILWLATGNNLAFQGDLLRRILSCRIDPLCERPEERTFDVDLKAYVRKNRKRLVKAALTIIRAYHCAGKPAIDAKAYGSFETWCDFVRYPLMWVGTADPVKSREKLAFSDKVSGDLKELLNAWFDCFGSDPKTASAAMAAAREDESLNAALLSIGGKFSPGGIEVISTKAVGDYLRKYKDRIEDGLKFTAAGTSKRATKWAVVEVEKRPEKDFTANTPTNSPTNSPNEKPIISQGLSSTGEYGEFISIVTQGKNFDEIEPNALHAILSTVGESDFNSPYSPSVMNAEKKQAFSMGEFESANSPSPSPCPALLCGNCKAFSGGKCYKQSVFYGKSGGVLPVLPEGKACSDFSAAGARLN